MTMTKTDVKTCPKCHGEKPLNEFMYAEKVRSRCNDCERQQTKWRIARPENRLRTALKDARRTAAKHGAVDTLTLDDLRYLFTLSGGRCAYSGKFTNKPSVEHLIPLANGGTNTFDNVQIVDLDANRSKRNTDPIEFIEKYYGLYASRDILELVAARRGVDLDVVCDEFYEAHREFSNEAYRKMIGGAGE